MTIRGQLNRQEGSIIMAADADKLVQMWKPPSNGFYFHNGMESKGTRDSKDSLRLLKAEERGERMKL